MSEIAIWVAVMAIYLVAAFVVAVMIYASIEEEKAHGPLVFGLLWPLTISLILGFAAWDGATQLVIIVGARLRKAVQSSSGRS